MESATQAVLPMLEAVADGELTRKGCVDHGTDGQLLPHFGGHGTGNTECGVGGE